MSGNPTLIKSDVVPLRNEITAKMIPKLLEELAGAADHAGQPLLIMYVVGGQKVLQFPGFGGQQPGLRTKREAPSRFPAPPTITPATVPPNSGLTPDELRTNSGLTPEEDGTDSRLSLSRSISSSLSLSSSEPATPTAADGGRTPAVELVAAANRGITERFGEQPDPLRASAGTTLDAVEAIEKAGVPVEFARDAIYTRTITGKLSKPPYSLGFYTQHVVERWESHRAHEQAKRSSASVLPGAKSNGANGASAAVTLDRIRSLIREHQQPGQPTRRYIALADVEAMGGDVLRAYRAIGGADRVLTTPAEKWSWLAKEFAEHLEAAHV